MPFYRKALLPLAALLLLASAEEAATEAGTEYPGHKAEEKTEEKDDVGGKTRKEKAEGLSFCEYDDCYELLGVEPTAGTIPIKRAYRRLAAEYHPDKCPSGDYEKCKEVFPKYANAYEILSSSEMRKNYDYVLANPYEFPSFYMKYSRPKYAPKSDLRFVLVLSVLAAAGVQYMLKMSMYEQALSTVKKHPSSRYNERLKALMAKEGPPSPTKKPASGGRGDNATKAVTKSEAKAEDLDKRKKAAEEALMAEFAAELPPPPSVADNVAVDLFKAPLTITYTLMWALAGGMREPGYMTRKALGYTADEWADYDEAEQADLVGRELWVSANLEAYEEEVAAAEGKGKGQKSGKEKREARLKKKNKNNPSAAMVDE